MHDVTKRPYLCLFAMLACVGLVADQVSKHVVFAKLYPADTEWESRIEVIPGLFDLRTIYLSVHDSGDGTLSFLRTLSGERLPHVNRGALFGIGNDGEGMNSFFAVVSVLAACFIIAWATRPTVANDRWLCAALGLILGGTLGNLYDRIVFSGVRDFLHWYYVTADGKLHVWPDFNVADACLVCGAGVLLAHSFLVTDPVAAPAKTETASADAPLPVETTSPTPGA